MLGYNTRPDATAVKAYLASTPSSVFYVLLMATNATITNLMILPEP